MYTFAKDKFEGSGLCQSHIRYLTIPSWNMEHLLKIADIQINLVFLKKNTIRKDYLPIQLSKKAINTKVRFILFKLIEKHFLVTSKPHKIKTIKN